MPARVAHAQTMSGLTVRVREPAVLRRDRFDQVRAGGAGGPATTRLRQIFGKIFSGMR